MTVGIDIGTTSVKAVAVDESGTILTSTRLPHALTTSPDGVFTHDIDQAWRANVVGALNKVGSNREVRGVAVAAMVPSLGAVNADGHGIGPGLLYGDHRGAHDGEVSSMPGDGGEIEAFGRWLAHTHPDAAAYWPAQGVANHALCGRGVIDFFTAMTAYPLYGITDWDDERATSAGLSVAQLPQVVQQFETAGTIRQGLAGAGAPLGGGTIDGYGEQIVSGADHEGDVLVICGTTLITWAVTNAWTTAPGLWSIPHQIDGRCMIGGPSNAGGLFQDHVRGLVGKVSDDDIAECAPGDIPVWLPYVRGERTPFHRRDLRASLHDVGMHVNPGAVVRAGFEAAGFVVRHHLDIAGVAAKRIVATGGGTRSSAWMQAIADCTGLPVAVAANPFGAARGAAFLARCIAEHETSVVRASDWARVGRTVEPRRAWTEHCTQRYERFRLLADRAVNAL